MPDQDKPMLVALRARREGVIQALTTHFANDALDMDEFEQRLDLAHRATSVAGLEELLADLRPVPTTSQSESLPAVAPAGAVSTARPASKRLLAIMSSTQRKGSWRVPQKLRVVSVMSAVELDFREAELGPGVTEVVLRCVMASVSILVPPGLAVECSGFPIMGHFEVMDAGPTRQDPQAPLLRIKGVALMGSVEIATEPSETSLLIAGA